MGARTEIGWTTPGEDGLKRHVCAQRFGAVWQFFERPRRRGREIEWEPMPNPPLSDWLELLDAVTRRATRRLHPPSEIERIKQTIRERFPEYRFE
jgi:hypothetical protein